MDQVKLRGLGCEQDSGYRQSDKKGRTMIQTQMRQGGYCNPCTPGGATKRPLGLAFRLGSTAVLCASAASTSRQAAGGRLHIWWVLSDSACVMAARRSAGCTVVLRALPAHGGDGDGSDAAHDGGARAQPHEAVPHDLLVAGFQQRLCLPELWVCLHMVKGATYERAQGASPRLPAWKWAGGACAALLCGPHAARTEALCCALQCLLALSRDVNSACCPVICTTRLPTTPQPPSHLQEPFERLARLDKLLLPELAHANLQERHEGIELTAGCGAAQTAA